MGKQYPQSVESRLLCQIRELAELIQAKSYVQSYPTMAQFPIPGVVGTLYVDESTGNIYVWNGTSYNLLSTGITVMNALTASAQFLVTGDGGSDFNIVSSGTTHTFNIPTASSTKRGLLSSIDWTTFNNKQDTITLTTIGDSGAPTFVSNTLNVPAYTLAGLGGEPAITPGTTLQYWRGDKSWQTLNTTVVPEGTNLYYTDARSRSSISLTTTGTSGAATYSSSTGVLNIPQYQTALTNPVTGTGTTNYLPKWTSSSAIGNSLIQDNGLNVGVNTAPTTTKFTVSETANSWAAAFIAPSSNELQLSGNITGNNNGPTIRAVTSGGAAYTSLTLDGSYIDLKISGTSQQRIFTTGNVSIGSTTDAGVKLFVNGSGRIGGVLMQSNTPFVTGGNISEAAGSLAIGTTGPTTLNFYTNNTFRAAFVSTGEFLVGSSYNPYTAANRGNITISGTSTQVLGFSNGTAQTGYLYYNGSALELQSVTGTLSVGTLSSQLVQITTNNTPRLQITAGGNVLINTTTDAGYKLDVNGTFNVRSNYAYFGGDANTAVYAGSFSNEGRIGVGGRSSFPTAALTFYTADGINNFERMRISSAGNVGIGTASPAARLHAFASFTDSAIEEVVRIQRSGLSSYNGERQTGLVFADEQNPTLTAAISGLRNNPSGHFLGGITFRVSKSIGTPITSISALSEVARITSDGNFGLGTTSPLNVSNYIGTSISGTNGSFLSLYTGASQIGRMEVNTTADFTIKSIANVPLILGTNNTEAARIFTSRNIAIGNTTDAGYRLDVNGTVRAFRNTAGASTIVSQSQSGNVALFQVTNPDGTWNLETGRVTGAFTIFQSGATTRLLISDTGNVGIGTTTPSFNLDISASLPQMRLNSTSGTDASLYRAQNSGGTLYIGLDNSAGSALSTGAPYSANIYHSGAYPIIFHTNSTQRMRITSDGNIGIGTTIPQARLQVGSGNMALSSLISNTTGSTPATGTQKLILGGNSSNGVGNEIGWYPNNSFQGDIAQITAFATAFGSSAAGALVFRTNSGVETTPSERMRIHANGNVAIGSTTDSGKKLAVTGDIKVFSGVFAVNDTGTGDGLTIFHSGSNIMNIQQNNNAVLNIGTGGASGDIVFNPNSSNAMRITGSGGVRIIPRATAPTPAAGTLYYDSTTNKLKLYDGTSWVDLN